MTVHRLARWSLSITMLLLWFAAVAQTNGPALARAAAANSARLVVRTCNDFVSVCNPAGVASFNVYRPILVSCRHRAGI